MHKLPTYQVKQKPVHATGDKWQWRTLFPSRFDLSLSIVKSVFDCHLPGVEMVTMIFNKNNENEFDPLKNVVNDHFHQTIWKSGQWFERRYLKFP